MHCNWICWYHLTVYSVIFFLFLSLWIAKTPTPSLIPHPHSFHSYFHPQLDSAGSVWFSNEIVSLCLKEGGGGLFLLITQTVTCPLDPGSNFQSSVSVYSRLFDFNLIFYRSASLQAFDSVNMSLVWIAYLHLNWAEMCQWRLLDVLFTPKDYVPLPLSVSVTRF